MDETLTPAARLRVLAGSLYHDEAKLCEAGADALDRLAQTCGNCAYGGVSPTGPFAFCDADGSGDFVTRRHPFAQRLMPLDERCKGWTKREDA